MNIVYESNGETIKKINGKCAMGELGCRAGMIPETLAHLSEDEYWRILRKYETPIWLKNNNLPYLSAGFPKKYDCLFDLEGCNSLSDYIYTLNDDFRLTEPEIADFLETTFEDAV